MSENINKHIEVVDAPIGYIFKDWYEHGIRCLIKQGRTSLFACLGIPKNHPLAGFNCNDLPLNVNGGRLCFSRCISNDDGWPDGYYWYGWDYEHHAKALTVEMVEKEVKAVAFDFKQLALFSEKFVLKHEAFLIEKVNDELFDFLHKQYNYHKKNLEHDADCCEKGLTNGMLYAYTDVYRKILDLNPPTDIDTDDCELDVSDEELETYVSKP